MEEMIKRIIDMDRKAQEITEAARREKLESEKELFKRAEALKEEYLDRARRRIQINAETEQTLLEQKWRKREGILCRTDGPPRAAVCAKAYAVGGRYCQKGEGILTVRYPRKGAWPCAHRHHPPTLFWRRPAPCTATA